VFDVRPSVLSGCVNLGCVSRWHPDFGPETILGSGCGWSVCRRNPKQGTTPRWVGSSFS
jgi:hypothetical protein